MKMFNKGILLIAVLLLLLGLAACGGGGSDTPDPTPPDPWGWPGGGDPDPGTIIGLPTGQFSIPGGFGDIRGIAASQEYVYIASDTVLYAFDKNGNYVNQVAAPARIQAVAVFPPKAEVDLPGEYDYFLAGFPVILHEPVPTVGYLRIYGPSLDTMTTREDAGHPDASKFISLPGGQVIPPLLLSWVQVLTVYDMDVDRFGSIILTADVDLLCTPDIVPDYPRALQVLNVFNDFVIEYGAGRECSPIDFPEGPDGVPAFHRVHGYASGDQGTLGIDTLFPFNRTELRYSWYSGHFNLLRDYVGVSFIELDPSNLTYNTGAAVDNNFGYNRVIGESVGNAPGSFSANPPVFDGALEDPDLTNGGPSGMGYDPMTDNIYICDPGNRRIQVFDQETGDYLFQVGNTLRGTSGDAFLAPSEAFIDLEGNLFIADVNMVRVIRGSFPDRQYGHVGGTVRNDQLGTPLEGATVTLGNELGALALRTTNINGDYLFQNLLVGQYFLTAGKFNYDSDTTSISILSDRTIRADFNLFPNAPATVGAYTGSVIDDFTNIFIPEVTVQIVGLSMNTQTDDIGRFQLNNILPGSYQVRFTHENYEPVTMDLEIFAGQTTDHPNVKMQPVF
jgi:hypothetical protein